MLVALLTKLNKTRISEKLCTVTELTSFCLLLNDLVICSQFNVPKYQLFCTLVSLLHLLYLWSPLAPYLSCVTRPVQESATFFLCLTVCYMATWLHFIIICLILCWVCEDKKVNILSDSKLKHHGILYVLVGLFGSRWKIITGKLIILPLLCVPFVLFVLTSINR